MHDSYHLKSDSTKKKKKVTPPNENIHKLCNPKEIQFYVRTGQFTRGNIPIL